MNRDALRALLLERFGRQADAVLREALPAVRFSRQIIEDIDIPIGGSKIGGRPDLPPGFRWPGRYGTAHSFLAQISLGDVAPQDEAHLLPRAGMLYFFYGIAQGVSGFDPDDRSSWMAAYHDGGTGELTRTDPPPSLVALDAQFTMLNQGLYTSCWLMPHGTLTLPDRYSERGFRLAGTLDSTGGSKTDLAEYADDFDEKEDVGYAGVLARLRSAIGGPRHQMLGYPALVQADMELECQLVSHGIYYGNESWRDDSRTHSLVTGARDWVLLLQVDTDIEANLEWGDSARLYFWIQRQALAARDFTNAWFVYQSC